MSEKIICTMSRVGKVFPPKHRVLNDISLSYFLGAKIGVLGLNGSGKSTFLNIMAGVETDFEGDFSISKGYTVGYVAQEPDLDDSKTVKEIVEEGLGETAILLNEYEAISNKFGEEMTPEEMDALINKQGALQEKIDELNAWDLESRLEMAMEALRCPSPDTSISVISGGGRRRVALCRVLLSKPDILLLDEPTNHLDAETVQWLERHLQEYEGTVIAVTHDRYFLDNAAGWILELDRGEVIPYKGNYSAWLEQKEERLRHEDKARDKRKKVLARELEWVRASPSARRAKSKARIQSYEDLLQEAQKPQLEELQLYVPPGPRLGDVVINFENVSKSFGDILLYDDLSFKLPRGGIVGIIGPNGAGKTTLFNMIMGLEQPDGGTIQIGETVQIAYAEQSRESLVPNKSVWEVISDGLDTLKLGPITMNSRAYVSLFNFHGTDQQKPVEVLSGGERNRVLLARVLKSESNVLMLDEPTNDLDVNAIRALEDALVKFAGCAVVISHDRWFLDRVATHILAFEGDSSFVWHEGNYSDYEEDRRKRLGQEADQPRRIRYRKLTRD
ncbi:MAG: energy-dependent translational throttle protein EttA [Candidatus Lindowbacteria bacterium]|nr:energy-dependent translational throttle protein EttA [Candidatus Lindowbacteria bacterium]